VEFEYDPDKSVSNRAKHGIDFEDAKRLWDDEFALEVPSAYEGEDRLLIIGEIQNAKWTAIVTRRGDVIRIISVRRSRSKEIETYDDYKRA
jgi:hypothetical protein